mgnify:CR=1 FL=1
MRMEKIVLNEERNVTLTVYLQEVGGEFGYMAKRPGIMVIPGGGYQFCSDREADPVALPYLKAGFQAFILRYSVKEDAVWPNPLEDYEQAMSLIRSKAEEWGVYGDKMAVVGFSAGGHLAAAAASMAKNRPNAAILGYAVTGADVRACNRTAPDIIPGRTMWWTFPTPSGSCRRWRTMISPLKAIFTLTAPTDFPRPTHPSKTGTALSAGGFPAGWRTASGG